MSVTRSTSITIPETKELTPKRKQDAKIRNIKGTSINAFWEFQFSFNRSSIFCQRLDLDL